jgi:hypothetical protein
MGGGRAPWEAYGVFGGGRLIDEFHQHGLDRLPLALHHDTSSAATGSGSPATPNASASSLSGVWGARSPRPHYPLWAAREPAALSGPPSHALTIPCEPFAVGGRSLRAFCVVWFGRLTGRAV